MNPDQHCTNETAPKELTPIEIGKLALQVLAMLETITVTNAQTDKVLITARHILYP